MQPMNRRHLMKLVGVSAAFAAAGIAISPIARRAISQADVLRIRARLGLPQPPLPSYATYVVEGSLDLAAGTGVLTSRVVAGHPGDPSNIALPGLGRVMTITGVESQGSQLTLRGVIEDRSQLQPGEDPRVQLVVDQARGVLRAPLGGRPVVLNLA
jgi:hypothetical protein